MQGKIQIFMEEGGALPLQKLRWLIENQGFSDVCEIIDGTPDDKLSGELFVIPADGTIRPGAVLDRIHVMQRSRESRLSADAFLPIGKNYQLDIDHHVLFCEGGDDVRLTEKESAILKLLYDAGGRAVSRDAMLRDVWDYAPDIDTHTLETHVYRLRQKIEAQPSEPSLVMTADEGYYLATS